MKIALLSPYSEISAIGIRTISAYLKERGFSTRLLFLPLQKNFYSREEFSCYSDGAIDQIAKVLKNDDLIGISFMTNFYDSIKDLTIKLKQRLPDKPFLWGGIHPTVTPDQCMENADYVCIGEGEVSCLELCQNLTQGKSTRNIAGIWSKENGHVHRNKPLNIIKDLDQIPAPDYDLEENYILISKKNLIKLTETNIKKFLGVTYYTMYTRGCPFSCAYCSNDALRKINKDLTRIRAKSPECMVQELVAIKNKFPFIEYINFQDDTFFALSEEAIRRFAECYKKDVALPFMIPGIHPSVFSEKKLEYFVDSGLLRIRMGIQSGSQGILKDVYKRKQDNDKVIDISRQLQKHSKYLTMPNYDIIVDNPWETLSDRLRTIELLSQLAAPFSINIYSLQLFPGTRLYERGIEEGIINEKGPYKPYYQTEINYVNLIIRLFGVFKVPRWLLKMLLSKRFINTKKGFKILHNILYDLTLYRRGIVSIFTRDYSMFPYRLQSIFCRIMPPKRPTTR